MRRFCYSVLGALVLEGILVGLYFCLPARIPEPSLHTLVILWVHTPAFLLAKWSFGLDDRLGWGVSIPMMIVFWSSLLFTVCSWRHRRRDAKAA